MKRNHQTEDANNSSSSSSKYYYWEFGQTAAALVIFVMIVVGNISILHRLKSCRRRRSNVNYFIVQLAIADLFVGFFSVTLDSVLRFQKAFTYGLMACRASKYIQVLFIYSSTYLLVALSIDRWEAVVKPLAFTQNRSRGYYLVAGAWFLACISATPVTLSVTIKEIEGFPQCWITYDVLGWKIYMVYLTCSLLVIPALIIAVCYTHIVYTIWRKGQLVTKQKQVKRNNELGYRLQQKQQQEQQQQQQQQQLREEQDRLQQLPSLQMQQPPNGAQLTLHSTSGGAFELSSDPIRKRESQAKDNGSHMNAGIVEIALKEEQLEDVSTEDEYVSSGEEEYEKDEDLDSASPSIVDRRNDTRLLEMNKIDSAERGGIEAVHDQRQQQTVNITTNRLSSKRKRFRRQITTTSTSTTTTTTATTTTTGRCRNYAAQQHGSGVIPKARIKTIKMTLVIVAAFVLCWSPFCIINLCSVFGIMKSDTNWSIALMTLSQSLAHLNSAVNPIIFWIFSSKRSSSSLTASSDTRAINNRAA